MTVAWKASRYDKGGEDYVNCPLDAPQYYGFVDAVVSAEKVPTRDFERCIYFEGCMPVEEMARRGRDTLAFGPMRPVGLIDPRSGRRPHACVQLRQDDAEGRLFNMVGFQTKMTYPEQRRVFRLIPGLAQAEFVRLGSLHRNTFVDAPALLMPSLQVVGRKRLFLAGQIVGVEGYVESAATGLLAGINAARLVAGKAPITPPRATALGSLLAYVTQRGKKAFQPMNANYGLFPPLTRQLRGRDKKLAMAERALGDLARWCESVHLEAEPASCQSVA
jgi:methylenetetrahydrofolate--tRNA-(uracil-5-)-methyltransferase